MALSDPIRILVEELHGSVALYVRLDGTPSTDPQGWCIHLYQGDDFLVFPLALGERFATELLAAAVTLRTRAHPAGPPP